MLAVATEPAEGCGILVMGPPSDDEQWRAYIRTIDELQARIDPRTRPVLIQMLRRGIAVPSPVVRRELSQLRQRIRADAVNAVIVEDASIRLVQTALDWLHRPHYTSSNHPDFAAALAQIEKALGRRVPALPRLYREISRKF
ncbi:MAG TPA: hypothetical protein PLW65_05350 [Pseudomonadota bacterium]|nr:hypothetical protein [Pseudomonadota bacterium]